MQSSLVRQIRSRLRPLRARLRRTQTQLVRRLSRGQADWHSALHKDELGFWENALTDHGANWYPGEFEERTNPELEVQPFIKALVDAPAGGVVRLLDVGAGPLTRLGKKWAGRVVEITAVDPLAAEYDTVLAKLNINPPVRTQYALAERLLDVFPADSFDLAYASNCLDHCCDPLEAIRQMLAVVKPGSHAYLWHFANVGVTENYAGLHQWNFDITNDEFTIDDGRKRIKLVPALQDIASVTCEVQRDFGNRVVVARLRKHQGPCAQA